MYSKKLGQNIMIYRKEKNMTIRDFSEHAGISSSLISQIERGKANPSLNVLELIAKALEVPLYTLFANDIDPDVLISRKEDRSQIYRKNLNHTVYNILSPDFANSPIEVLSMDLNGHSSTTDYHYSHKEKEEIAILIQGEVYVELNGEEHLLYEQDYVRIPPNTRHRFINKSDLTCSMLFVLTPAI
ncbi:MAG: helix-turn-helix domain-containing protein [Firmicutes bacterium]|jgi:transcriptional regulator with XRE-family HTH domain|nr:helix-turn-helix domain-containing protein [Bacillota bacterium]